MEEEVSRNMKLVLIGYFGSGKSATGNTILGEDFFEASIGQIPVTTGDQSKQISLGNLHLTVIDTPGMDDTNQIDKWYRGKNFIYALVVRIGRISEEQRDIIEGVFTKYRTMFKDVIIIFSNANELKMSRDTSTQTVEGWLKKVPTLRSIIKRHKVPYVLFENVNAKESEKKKQVEELCAILQELDQTRQEATKRCPVSEGNDDYIYVTRDLMEHEFGSRGKQFFEEQHLKQTKEYTVSARSCEHSLSSSKSGRSTCSNEDDFVKIPKIENLMQL